MNPQIQQTSEAIAEIPNDLFNAWKSMLKNHKEVTKNGRN
ncbi:hypothetical protein LCGC14_2655210 [marine sediment metagenome]|uniref:Uncharacterized protein n=1 Tax=marine sediment metagenome TaxID=412755 RepID=A0A0F9AFV8_9ZZZZ